MSSEKKLPRRDFLRNAVMLAGAGVTAPLWAAMKYDRNVAMRYFREQASETDVRVKRRAGVFRSVASAGRMKWRRRATGAPSSASSTSAARIQPLSK